MLMGVSVIGSEQAYCYLCMSHSFGASKLQGQTWPSSIPRCSNVLFMFISDIANVHAGEDEDLS